MRLQRKENNSFPELKLWIVQNDIFITKALGGCLIRLDLNGAKVC